MATLVSGRGVSVNQRHLSVSSDGKVLDAQVVVFFAFLELK